MNARNVLTVYLKELRDTLRDRRALFSMIIIPTFLMPVIMMVVGTISYKVVKKARQEVPSVMIVGGADSPAIVAALKAHPKIRIVDTAPDWRERISAKTLRAAVEFPDGFEAALERGEQPEVKILHYEGELKSGFALGELRTFFNDLREKTVSARLTERGLPAALVKPFEIRSENVAAPEKVGGNAIGGFIPYLFILLCFTGAMYPAIDLTAGEKERGTMETLLCSPVARIDLVLGKFFLVLTASLATVVCSVTSLLVSLFIGGTLLMSSGGSGAAAGGAAAAKATPMALIDPVGLIGVVLLVIPLAVLFASVLLTLSLFAKSHKEAQTYVSPLIIVIVLPAVIGMLPGVELNAKLALVPILNVSLASKELVSGVWPWADLALIFISTCVYASVAFALCVRMFNREDVIFRS